MDEDELRPAGDATAADGAHDALGRRPLSKRAAWGVLALVVASLPVVWLGLKDIRLKNDVESWLPADDPNAVALAWYHEHFENYDRMLLSWESSSLDDPRVEALAASLPDVVGVEDAVSPQSVIDRMVSARVPYDEAVKRLNGVLVGTGPLKVRLTDARRDRLDGLLDGLGERATEAVGFEVRARPAPARGGEAAAGEESVNDKKNGNEEGDDPAADDPEFGPKPYDIALTWDGIQPGSQQEAAVREWLATLDAGPVPLIDDVFFQAGAPVAIAVSVGDAAAGRLVPTLEAIRDAAEAAGVPRDELRTGGSPVAAGELNGSVLKAVRNPDVPLWQFPKRTPMGASLLAGVLLAFVMLRSVRLAGMVMAVAVWCTVVTLALVAPTGGTMSVTLVIMPSLLLVLTMSGAIHVANYWKHAATENPESAGTGRAVRRAARQAAVPCGLASLTTGIGLLSLGTSPLAPVRDFGVYSAVGCGVSLVAVLVLFPAMMRVWPGKPGAKAAVDRDRWAAIGRWITGHARLVSLSCFAVFVAGIAGLHKFRTETKVIKYFPDDARIVRDYQFLEENLSGIVPVHVIVGFQGAGWGNRDVKEQLGLVRTIEKNLAEHELISGTLALPDFLPTVPEDASPRQRALFNRKIFKGIQDAVESPEDGGAGQFVTRVRDPLHTERDAGNGTVRFDVASAPRQDVEADGDEDLLEAEPREMGQEIYKVTAQVSVLAETEYGPFLEEVDRLIRDTIAEWEAARADRLAEFADEEFEEDEAASEARVEYLVTGTVPLFLRTQEAVLESLIRAFGLAFGIIAVVMMIILGSARAGLITMIPNLMPVGLVFGLVSWAEVPVDIGTMITASVALGVAVDGTLHLLSWFRERLGRGESASDAIAEGLSHCGPAMWQTSTVVSVGLLCLMFADLLLVSRFGWLMAALIVAALFADLVFLPSLLAGKLGRVIEKRIRRRVKTGPEPTVPPPTERPTLRVVHEDVA